MKEVYLVIGEKGHRKYNQDMYFDKEDILKLCFIYGNIIGNGKLINAKGVKSIEVKFFKQNFQALEVYQELFDKHAIEVNIKEKFMSDDRHAHKYFKLMCSPLISAMTKLFYINNIIDYKGSIPPKIFEYEKEMLLNIIRGIENSSIFNNGVLYFKDLDRAESIQELYIFLKIPTVLTVDSLQNITIRPN